MAPGISNPSRSGGPARSGDPAQPGDPSRSGDIRAFVALAGAGFRRWSAYRQATYASIVTNTVFGFLRVYVLFAVAAGAGGVAAGYDDAMLSSYVWLGQGLIGVVLFWGDTDLADRVRTGEVTADLLRPIDPLWAYLAADLGRAGHAVLVRFAAPVAVGAMLFPFYVPERWLTYPMFGLSVLLAVTTCFACRHLLNLTSFWLLDVRGVMAVWSTAAPMLAGLIFPLRFLPDWAQLTLWIGTPFPALLQAPLDVWVEYGGRSGQLLILLDQLLWLTVMLTVCRLTQRRAVRRLVIQGG